VRHSARRAARKRETDFHKLKITLFALSFSRRTLAQVLKQSRRMHNPKLFKLRLPANKVIADSVREKKV
jgi:hypothetical protein